MKKLVIILLPILICSLGCKKDTESEIPTGWQESMSGKILFSRKFSGYNDPASRLFYYDVTGINDVTPIGNEYGEIFGASWSPDGSQVVFNFETDHRFSLNIINSDGTNERTIWQKESFYCKTGPVWLSDTNLIGFATYNYNNDIIQITNSMGDSLQSYIINYGGSPYNITKLKRSPKNNAITYHNRTFENSIIELNVITHSNNIFYEFPDSSYSSHRASISKDGKSVAYMNRIGVNNKGQGIYHLLIIDVQGGAIIQDIDLTQFGLSFRDLSWSPDGEMIAIGLRREVGGSVQYDRTGILICDIHGNIVTHLIDADVRSVDWQ